jgi:hypothetical protein
MRTPQRRARDRSSWPDGSRSTTTVVAVDEPRVRRAVARRTRLRPRPTWRRRRSRGC